MIYVYNDLLKSIKHYSLSCNVDVVIEKFKFSFIAGMLSQ